MPLYHQLGTIPRKRHAIFRQADGRLYAEELMGNKGFDGLSSLLYHVHAPTAVRGVRPFRRLSWEAEPDPLLRHRHFLTGRLPETTNIADFEPRVGRFHLPPPVHQTFEGDGFVVCSFCPRPYDFDPEAVPVPYNHSNVMSDEVIYHASSEFMSRTGIEYGSITLHPDGIPHGPQPGRTEQSLGQARTDERAVMLDSFRPLRVAAAAATVEDAGYLTSWLEGR